MTCAIFPATHLGSDPATHLGSKPGNNRDTHLGSNPATHTKVFLLQGILANFEHKPLISSGTTFDLAHQGLSSPVYSREFLQLVYDLLRSLPKLPNL